MVEIRPQALGRSQNILPNDACGVLEAVTAEALLLDLLVQRVQNRRVQRVLLDLVVGERLPVRESECSRLEAGKEAACLGVDHQRRFVPAQQHLRIAVLGLEPSAEPLRKRRILDQGTRSESFAGTENIDLFTANEITVIIH